ncbi:hypothetical protein EIP91_009847 [Steccherinum ochraceum]|uniref:Uncharacterized protein n=1 Tax=Steccherinum ochraceum TaxID=92696 RepID=A0A4R0R6L1_9APHY|nr:hypothetical protein EIP91_009847 [Steccherinum ochraceum]
MSSVPSPAHHTKHVPLLQYPFRNASFHISQLDNGHTNGSALWLGAQCLSLYLADLYATKSKSLLSDGCKPRAIELGSGVGLTALALASMGWDVLATDLPPVIDSVLSGNVARNVANLPAGSGSVQVRTLDWTVPPNEWSWDHPTFVAHPDPLVACAAPACSTGSPSTPIGPPFQLIVSADTVYSASLVSPFLRTLHHLCTLSRDASPSRRPPPVYVCLERRDPALVVQTLSQAKQEWGFLVERVPHKKVHKAMVKGGLNWSSEDWEGIEIWKFMLRTT